MKFMNHTVLESARQKIVVLALIMGVPAVAWAQHKNGPPPTPHAAPAPHASAPAPHASAPAHTSPPAQHTNAPVSHGGSGNMSRPANSNTAGRGAMNTPGHSGPGNSANTHGGTNTTHGANNANMAHGTNTAGRGGATNTSHNNNMGSHNATNTAAGHGANAGHNGPNGAHVAANRTPPGRQVALKGGGVAHIRPNGQIRSINRNGMQIQHGVHGGRTVVSTHNGARVVTTAHGGYVQRNYVVRNGNTYVSRTYVVNNVTYTNVYRSYNYGGYCCYYGYAPAYYYHPVYYGWAYNPWPAPVYYGWGWQAEPWYGYYGPYYYQPYPVYPSAAFWLTDYLIAASLRASYEASVEVGALDPLGPDFPLVAGLGMLPAAPDTAKSVVLTKEVKDQLADEVKAQLAADQADAGKSGKSSGSQSGGQASSGGTLPALDPKRRIFVVHNELTVVADGDECDLTDGDVISRISDTPDDDKNVDVKILASKKNDCGVGKQVAVTLDDLQEMHNHFREQLTGGMDELSKKQGTGGLPKAPDTAKQDGEVPAPAADSSAAKTLKEQQAAADKTEADVKQEAASSGGGSQ
ncbi:MAG TPA: hypothetical protein VE377_22310 [Candidatus Dormibacteraeota bacterium]|nr:hypothetical protein [Candidatus Dormibacteraeota bacterium]